MKAQIAFIHSFLERLRETQYLPRADLLRFQRGLLEPLLRHARAHVPFYRDSGRLNPLFRSDGSIDWGRWEEVPRLSRSEVQGAGRSLCADFLPPGHGPVRAYSTSGSTGEPVTVSHTERANGLVWAALVIRDLEQHQIDPSRRLAYLNPYTRNDFDIRGARRHEVWFPPFGPLGLKGERFDLSDTRLSPELIDALMELRPDYLRVQAITLELLVAFDRESRLSDLKLGAVMTLGEHLPSEARSEVERHFGCRVLDWYGSNECGRMATTCAQCGRLHVQEENVFVEALDDNGRPVAPGHTGWLVVTPLHNFAMPLIRYHHADRAVVGEPDRCRVTLRALDAVLGKERSPFVFPNGAAIRPTLPTSAIIDFLGARAYQVAQVAPDRCEFRIIPGEMPSSQMRFDKMTEVMRFMWWPGLQVEYRIVNSLPRSSTQGKLALFVREFAHANERSQSIRVRSGAQR